MIASGRQTAPPLYEVVLATSHGCHLSLEASPRDTVSLCFPLIPAALVRVCRAGADVCQYVVQGFAVTASACSGLVLHMVARA